MENPKDRWIQYTQNATIHGLDRAFDQSRKLERRVIWALIIIGTSMSMVFYLSLGVSKLLYPAYTTQISVSHASSIDFPAVTYCSMNMYRKTYVEKHPEVLAYIMLSNPSNGKYLTDNTTLMEQAEALSLKDIDHDKLRMKLKKASHPASDIVHYSRGFGEKIPRDNFVPVTTSMGMCYQFNKTQVVKAPGQENGLLLLPHSHCAFSEVQSRGIGAGLQTYTFISLQKRITHLVPEKGCVLEGTNMLELYDTYSQTACFNECNIKYLVKNCGCKFFYDPGNYSLCLTRMDFQCVEDLSKNDSYPATFCNCPPKCVEETFDTKIFGMPFPSEYTKDFYKRKGNEFLTGNWDKLARTTIYFETMDVTTVTERKAYSLDDFFSDVGGLMGLWLGASVVTLAELIEVLWDICSHRKHSRQSKAIKVMPENMISPIKTK